MPPTDIKEPPRHLPKFWHFSSSDDIANVEWEVCDCHLGNLDLLQGGERAIQGIGFRSVMGGMSNVFVPHFFPGYIFGETGTHLFSLFYLFLRTNHYPASWWHEKPKKIFLGFPPRRSCPPAVGQAVVGEEWEVGEKPSTFLRSHEGGVGQENTYKGWNNMLQTNLHPDDDDFEHEGKWLQILGNKMEPTDCANNLVPAQTTPLPS